MRHRHSTVTPADIQSRATRELGRLLPRQPVGPRCAVDVTLRILWMLATLRTSLFALCERFGLPYRQTHLRRSITTQLPDPATLAAALGHRLRALIPNAPRKGFVVAIDTHWCCYYGDRSTRGIVRGQRKAGTRRFFVYATAVIVEKGRRYTLAVTAPESNRPMEALRPLLDQIAAAGIRVRTLLLDKGFYATEVFQLLHARRRPHVVAVPHHRPHFRPLFRTADTATYTLRTRHRTGQPRAAVDLTLVRVTTPNRDGSVSEQVYAHHGLRPRGDLGAACRRRYRARFGIESSYRQLNQAKARTTTRDRRWRLLFVGLALLLRQLWVFLENAVHRHTGHRWDPATGLERLRAQLAHHLTAPLDDRSQLTIRTKDAQLLNDDAE
jgi:hypothetical protein